MRKRSMPGRQGSTMRFLIALGISIATVIAAWPLIRQYAPRRQTGEPKPVSKGETIYFAIVITLALTFVMSTLLWVFGGR
jgi:hypothetical protein